MAEQKKTNIHPSVGFYSEPGFVSLTSSLRKISGDDTIPTDNYVDIYTNLYDLISPDVQKEHGGVIDISITKDKNTLVIFYSDNTTKEIPLQDKFLYQAYFDLNNYTIYFVLKNGEKIQLDLNDLINLFTTKEEFHTTTTEIRTEVETIKTEVTELKTEVVTREEVGTIIEEKYETEINNIIENKLNEGVDNIKWLNF